jgi:hypothetical protein
MFCILIATPPLDEDDAAGVDVELLALDPLLVELLLELPQPAAARATTAQSASTQPRAARSRGTGRIRLMFITTPPRADPS